MGGNALTAVEDFDRAGGDACPNLLAQQLVWHRVVVLLDLDVIIESDPALLPFGKDIGIDRQRLERRTLRFLEQCATARTKVPRLAVIDLRNKLRDSLVQCKEREDLPIAKFRDDEASGELDSNLDLGFIPGPIRPCWQDRGAVVGRHFGVGPIDRGFIQARFGDTRAEIIAHHRRRNATHECKGTRVRADPIAKALRPGSFGISEARGAEHGDEQLRRRASPPSITVSVVPA